ncbi:hypothetical protein BZY95_17475 [Billgrantia desiderata SP1]|uniref:Uncharacterized protein n=1 Tax=Billgrantia desiderata TaxID=52021 RepID=A0ABS9B8A4_9GAMM|nr:hypothetical protein [Halomonas desiderata]MCE8011742.1 hypothetical protein [Halomonas desiderata]MCE8043544.1 hypothetical protein [Halomonas desiderata]MCE8048118.1 hypothetical protein [Halomonas desiderata]OUE38963.1 hypothetical protein BZY95_17475 [Halomonas desiderata SP1]
MRVVMCVVMIVRIMSRFRVLGIVGAMSRVVLLRAACVVVTLVVVAVIVLMTVIVGRLTSMLLLVMVMVMCRMAHTRWSDMRMCRLVMRETLRCLCAGQQHAGHEYGGSGGYSWHGGLARQQGG